VARGGDEAAIGVKPVKRKAERRPSEREHDRIAAVRRTSQQPAVHTGVAVVEVTAPLPSFDFATAGRWEVLVLCHGEPVARVAFPSPGAVDSAELARALIWPHASFHLRRRELEEELRARMGAPPPRLPDQPTCSVVLCTHGRPQHLATALASLAQLDPAPLEVIVVDNAPGERDCRAEVERRGFRYVREDRKGLDNARNAGARAARGEVVAFTDDDCVHPSGWLRHLESSFADPLVAAVTGPAFAYVLDVPARVRMERQASLTRGLRRRVFDWTLISPLHGGQAGVGANMAIRAALLRSVDEPFPPELDAGTETRSGGDTYLFARLLAAGHRIAYEPAAFVFHQHRPDWPALVDAVEGYGTGAAAVLTKLLREDGELEAPRAGLWLLSQYLRAQSHRLRGTGDAVATRIAWGYLRGSFEGPRAWRRARERQRTIDPALRPAPPFAPPTAAPLGEPAAAAPEARPLAGTDGAPAISVIVPTVGRVDMLARCLGALAAQTLPADAFEVIVVDDARTAQTAVGAPAGMQVRVHRTGGTGAAVARNQGAAQARGELALFIDDDLIAAPDLLERHLAHHAEHADEATVVIGCSPPRPPRPGLAALGAALWWEDQFRMLEEAVALTFTEALSGNVSLARATFLERFPFDPDFGRLRREDWEWGHRLLAGGARLHYAPDARAAHEYELSAGARLRACRLEGRGDVLLARRHPQAAVALPLTRLRTASWRRPLRRLVATLLGDPRADALVLPLLDLLERARLRGAWSALYRRAQRAAYAHGVQAAGWRRDAEHVAAPPTLDVDLDARDPLPAPGPVPPRVRVHAGGELLAQVQPREGWHPRLAVELAAQLAARATADEPAGETDAALPASVTVILGPGRRPGDARACDALEAAGARVVALEGAAGTHWDRVLEAAAAAETELVAIPLPGRVPTPQWLVESMVAFRAPRVALALGQGLPGGRPSAPLLLYERGRGRLPYAPLGGPVDYLVLRAEALPQLRTACAHAAYGPMAVAFACAEAVLGEGLLVARRDVHGLDASAGAERSARAREQEKLSAWSALLADRALAARGLRGPARLAAMTLLGALLGVRRTLRRDAAVSLRLHETAPALLRGYAAAFPRRDPSRTR
jgi:glycosyltransferase involved in cell wall biosynthesis